ncbi:hypothetical protein Tco_1292182 [Tanacetum coccineum]
MWSVTSPPSMPLNALSCNIFKNSSPISSLEFVIIDELVCSPFLFFMSSKFAITLSCNQLSPLSQEWRKMLVGYRNLDAMFFKLLLYRLTDTPYSIDQNTPYVSVEYQRLDTPHPTGGYAVSGDQSEQNTI